MRIGLLGVPSCGKTTTAKILSERIDALYVPEAARLHLEIINRRPNTQDQIYITNLQSRLENSIAEGSDKHIICDVPMTLCDIYYRLYNNNKLKGEVYQLCNKHKYDMQFWLHPLEYIQDKVRFQSSEDLVKIDNYIRELAPKYGPVFRVPGYGIEERVNFIIKKIKNSKE